MDPIKSFIYLDDYKMYSISSQIFRGMTEYITSSSEKKYTKSAEQKPELFSGQVLGDIVEQSKNESEKKFLNDYAFTLFENELRKNNRVLDINIDNVDETILNVDDSSFVAIKGRLIFNDTKIISQNTSNFNDLGYHVGLVSGFSGIQKELDELEDQVNKLKNRDQKAKLQQYIDHKIKIRKLIGDTTFHLNEYYLQGIQYLVDFGYNGQFEVQIPFSGNQYHLFSSTINREKLKENESTLIKKYARQTEKEFIVFGIPTQTKSFSEKLSTYAETLEESDDISMKEALLKVLVQLGNIEKTFVGKLSYEYIIDPIAIYREI